jgi:hypothetical protein
MNYFKPLRGKLKLFALSFIAIVLIFNSCKKDNKVDEAKTISDNKVKEYILSLGIAETDIQELGDHYLVEGDMVFNKKMKLPDTIRKSKVPATKQLWTGFETNKTTVNTILIAVDPSMDHSISLINSAISQWNKICDSRIRFSIGTTTNSHITITENNSMAACGTGELPNGGAPGRTIQINTLRTRNHSTAQRVANITHELGHTIGLLHTNNVANNNNPIAQIPGTPAFDSYSMMNGNMCGSLPSSLSNYDKIAITNLYPMPSSVTRTITVNNTSSTSAWLMVISEDCTSYQANFSAPPGISTHSVTTREGTRHKVTFSTDFYPVVFRAGYSAVSGTSGTITGKNFFSDTSDVNWYVYPQNP